MFVTFCVPQPPELAAPQLSSAGGGIRSLFFHKVVLGFSYPAVPYLGFLGSLIVSDGKYYSLVYTDTIDGGFAINRFEVLAYLQAPVSTLLYVYFPG